MNTCIYDDLVYYININMYQVIQYVPLIISIFKDTYVTNKNNMESDKEVISRLKFIGKVQKGEKINVKYMFVQPEGIATRISRTLINQDNRSNTLNFIRGTISRTFEIISMYETSTKEAHHQFNLHIVNDLKQAKNGLNNFKDTYLSDIKFTCDLDTLIQDIDAKLYELDTDNV
jgi:hypothetical protein